MARKKSYTLLTLVAVAAAISLGVFFSVFAGGSDDATAPGAGTPDELASETGPSTTDAQEGIKVHGHWTIEVRDTDGSLVTRREFDNALTRGALWLAETLGRVSTTGLWVVAFDAAQIQDQDPCVTASNQPIHCSINEPNDSPSGSPNHFETLTVSVPDSGPNLNKLVLSGTATALAAGTSVIDRVSIAVRICPSTTLPSECTVDVSTHQPFSKATIAPIEVVEGQQILVNVVISFS